jgi:hypothetical protein
MGFWFVFHPPKPVSTISQTSSTGTQAQSQLSIPQIAIPEEVSTKKFKVEQHTTSKNSSTKIPQAPQQPTYEQKCEGSACAQGPGSQATLINNGPPTPIISWEQDKIDKSAAGQYSVRVSIRIKNDMQFPSFAVVCDRPCKVGDDGPTYPSGRGVFQGSGGATSNPRVVAFTYSSPAMMPDGTALEWWINSVDGNPIKILDVFDPSLKR